MTWQIGGDSEAKTFKVGRYGRYSKSKEKKRIGWKVFWNLSAVFDWRISAFAIPASISGFSSFTFMEEYEQNEGQGGIINITVVELL